MNHSPETPHRADRAHETPSPKPELRVSLSDEELTDYLANKAYEKAEEKFKQRGDRTVRTLSILLSVFGFLGLGGVFGIVKYAAEAEARKLLENRTPAIAESVSRRVMREEVSEIRDDLTNELLLSNFRLAVDSLDTEAKEKAGFADSTRDEVMAAVRAIGSKTDLISRPQYRVGIRQTIAHFAGAGLGPQLSEIHGLASPTLLNDQQTVFTMCMHYGREIVGSPYSVDSLTARKSILDKYLAACSTNRIPEIALLWAILIEFDKNQCQRSPLIDSLVKKINDLNDKDRRAFHSILKDFAVPSNVSTNPTQEVIEVARIIGELRDKYRAELGNQEVVHPDNDANQSVSKKPESVIEDEDEDTPEIE